MAPILMGDLCDQEVPLEDKDFFTRVVKIVEENYPTDWRSWVVDNLSTTELFGGTLSSTTEAKLRFAIPTEALARAYSPSDPNLSEIKYRAMKRKLVQWPFGRALLYMPHTFVERIHPESYEAFMCTVKILKPRLTPRRCSSPSTVSRKRSSETPPSSPSSKSSRGDAGSSDIFFQRMMNCLTQQTQALKHVASRVANLSNTRQSKDSDIYDKESSSESEVEYNQSDLPDFQPLPLIDPPFACTSFQTANNRTSKSEEEALAAQIFEAQAKLAKLRQRSQTDATSELTCDFSPNIMKKEPKLAKADSKLVLQGKKCQRFGENGWKNIRYSEVQKTFHVTPVFAALKVNSALAGSTPRSNLAASLEKTDLTLGAITYGLFMQRKAFEEAWKKLSPTAQREIQKNFFAPDSEFKKVSDELVQYTCGRRAEVIQTRREVYKPSNKVLNNVLHEIPPSETHLFNDEQLTEAFKSQGGIRKFIPKTNFDGYNLSKKAINKKAQRRNSSKNFKKQQHFRTHAKQDRGNQKTPKYNSGSG